MPLPQLMNEVDLRKFRTRLCDRKAMQGTCELEERCPFSHCLSWHRRNPYDYAYRPNLCPNVIFCTEGGRMRVTNHCHRGRMCMFAHTKEEQMYHPLIYKTQLCRDWPKCNKHFCPFSHGLTELRNPETLDFRCIQGPELLERPTRLSMQQRQTHRSVTGVFVDYPSTPHQQGTMRRGPKSPWTVGPISHPAERVLSPLTTPTYPLVDVSGFQNDVNSNSPTYMKPYRVRRESYTTRSPHSSPTQNSWTDPMSSRAGDSTTRCTMDRDAVDLSQIWDHNGVMQNPFLNGTVDVGSDQEISKYVQLLFSALGLDANLEDLLADTTTDCPDAAPSYKHFEESSFSAKKERGGYSCQSSTQESVGDNVLRQEEAFDLSPLENL